MCYVFVLGESIPCSRGARLSIKQIHKVSSLLQVWLNTGGCVRSKQGCRAEDCNGSAALPPSGTIYYDISQEAKGVYSEHPEHRVLAAACVSGIRCTPYPVVLPQSCCHEHILHSMASVNNTSPSTFCAKIRQQSSNSVVQKEIYAAIFGAAVKKNKSFFLNSSEFDTCELSIPPEDVLSQCDQIVMSMQVKQPSEVIWLFLQDSLRQMTNFRPEKHSCCSERQQRSACWHTKQSYSASQQYGEENHLVVQASVLQAPGLQ